MASLVCVTGFPSWFFCTPDPSLRNFLHGSDFSASQIDSSKSLSGFRIESQKEYRLTRDFDRTKVTLLGCAGSVKPFAKLKMWTCPKCGERLEDQFDSCWKCAGQPEPIAPTSRTSRRWMRAFLLGVLFEIVLVSSCALLPRDSWLFPWTFNLLVWSHYPLLKLLDVTDVESAWVGIFLLLLVGLVMALVWAALYLVLSNQAARLAARLGISRRQKLFIGLGAVAAGIVAVGFAILHITDDKPRPFSPSQEIKSAVGGNTAFALDLYRVLNQEPGNVFVSPYSISTALGMVLAGARGQTEQEIAAALHLSMTQSNFHHSAGVLRQRMTELQRRGRIRLTVANSIWCQEGDPFTDKFLDLMRGPYQATAEQVDFSRDIESARRRINQWVQRNTANQFKDLVQPGQFGGDTSLVLCNAIYFKGRWASLFKRGETKPAPFYITKEQSVNVPMMHQTGEFKMAYASEDDFALQLLEMPYYGKDLSMVVMLPMAVDGLAELERRLESNRMQAWLAELDRQAARETHVWFPRFKTENRIDLIPLLKALGITTAFDGLTADLSGIDGIDNLYLSTALHQAFVEVDEEGTKAAAVTLFEAKTKGMSNRFNANHPFFFLIRENSTGTILFLGRVENPRQ
jgi:serpin B